MKLKNHIKEGLVKAYYQNIECKGELVNFESSIMESLITVNIIQELIIWNNENGNLHSINLEQNAQKFLDNAFAPYKQYLSHTLERGNHEVVRTTSGRMDIAIFPKYHLAGRSLVGIEVKGINPDYGLLRLDFKRLIQALTETDVVSENSVQVCYSTFIFNIGGDEKHSHEIGLNKARDRKFRMIKQIITDIANSDLLKIEGHYFDIERKTRADYEVKRNGFPEDHYDYHDVAKDTGLVIGVIIRMSYIGRKVDIE